MELNCILGVMLLSLSIKGYALQFGQQSSQQSQSCSLSESNTDGVCTRYSECPSAQMAYNNEGIIPVYCNNDQSDPIVCCARSSVTLGEKLGETSSTDKPKRRISEEKCLLNYGIRPPGFYGVAGGVNATPGEFPHMAALGWSRNTGGYDYQCGGSLISDSYVLTAAHCRRFAGRAPAVVLLGGENLDDNNPENPPVRINRIIAHPQYNRKQVYNDIALIELVQRVFAQKPICLWQNPTITHSTGTIIGYGQTQFEGTGSTFLLKADLPLFRNQDCSQFYGQTYRLENGVMNTQLCAGDLNKVRDTCPGDSGGPLLVKVTIEDKVVPYILGVTSFGQVCAAGPPGVYTRVSEYIDWIESIVWA